MSWQDCLGEIRGAAGRDLSDDDIHVMLEDIQLRADRMRRERVDLSQAELYRAAAREAGAEAEMAARIEARNAKLNLVKRVARREFYEAAPAVGSRPGILIGLEAKLVGVNTPFSGSRLSVAAQQNALRRDYMVGLTTEFDRAGLYETVRSGAIDRQIARELFELSRAEGGAPGVTGSKPAAEAAGIIAKYQALAREALNREGAWIGQYDGYIARTAHDPDKIRRATFEGWRDQVVKLLDERTFEGIADRERFLRGVYNALVTGVHLTPDGMQGFKDPAFKGSGNIAKRLSQGRVLHWRDADAWMDYQAAFGHGNLVEAVLRGLDQAARNTALMREFGTNPRGEFDADMQALAESWRDRDPDAVVKLGEARKWLANRFDELDGTSSMPVNRLGARIGASVRAWESMSKLGGATLSAVTDVPFKASELRYQGINLLEGYADGVQSLIRGRGRSDSGTREIIDLLRAGSEGMLGHIAGRFDAQDTVPGTLSKLTNVFFRWSGLNYWTDAQRAGAEFIMSRHLGRLQRTEFAALPRQTQRVLTLFDIKPEEWDALRAGEWVQADGRAHLTPDAASRMTDQQVDGLIGGKLDGIRQAALDRMEKAVDALDRLESRLAKHEAAMGKAGPTGADVERATMQATVEGVQRYQRSIQQLRQDMREMVAGSRTQNEVHQHLVREIGYLARAERELAVKAERRVARLKDRVPAAEAARDKAAAAIEGIHQDMLRHLDELDSLPVRLDEQMSRARDGARADLALKLHSYFSDRGEYAVINPGARERAMLRRGTQAGTLEGEALRFVGQFKAFPVAVISKVWGRDLYGGERGWGRAAGIVHTLVATTVMGYVAGMLKDLSKGRAPRDPTDPRAWGAAFLQGGGAGIYGDFLLGQYSRFGNRFLESAAGPTLSSAGELLNIWAGAREGNDEKAATLRWTLSNTPFVNLFYTRMALDYLFLYQVQEAMNPGFLRRFEQRVAKDNNQRFILSPSRAIPYGGGNRLFEGVRE
ncbi:hypothetical protein AZL_025370 [Azospirillum sp. B510]|uniref:hypothetical protein n=1 Tax=Azospirillum sp. (strain B510) TaxID=137722 RepID=UPI0001C4CBE7|nr:hypothetical protein [Azospirillum sp. B510]BAI73175.1 hypothetical protein AZL_025370 [Azospirillum sp. B510]